MATLDKIQAKVLRLQRSLQREMEKLSSVPETELMALLLKWNRKMQRHNREVLRMLATV